MELDVRADRRGREKKKIKKKEEKKKRRRRIRGSCTLTRERG
jgi:hypothetical protein